MPVQNLKQSLDRIYKNLYVKAPVLAKSFLEFARNYKNTTNYTEKYIWERAAFGLFDLKDERIVSLLPANCLNGNSIQIIQAIIRQVQVVNGATKVIFKYDPKIIDPLEISNPLQISYLLVHEWLWSYTANVEVLRKANWFFHTDGLDKLSASDLHRQLTAVGLRVPTEDPLSKLNLDCQPDPFGLDILFKMASANSNSGYSFAKFIPIVLRRFCDSFLGCSEPVLQKDGGHFSNTSGLSGFGANTFLTAGLGNEYGKVNININSSSHVKIPSHGWCELNVKTGKLDCTKQLVWKNQTWTNFNFIGHMSRECLKLTSNQRDGSVFNNGKEAWYETEYIIFSRYRLDQQ